jgi:hypothetical protein
MVQGIMGLNAAQPSHTARPLQAAQPSQAAGVSQDAVKALSAGFNNLSPDEITKLRELQGDLSELSPDKLQVLQQIIQFLKKNQDRYDEAVMMLVSKGIIEAGDLPPDYIPAFFEILEKMVSQAISGGREQFAKGGIAALRKKAQAVQRAGTGGDKILAHINPREAAMLQATRGGGMNPKTGLPEYGFFDDIGNFLKQAAPVILPVALNFLFPGLGTIASGAIGSGVGALINGASPGQALQSALLGGATGAVFSGVQGAMSGKGFMAGVQSGLPGAAQSSLYASQANAYSPVSTPATDAVRVARETVSPMTSAASQPSMFAGADNWIKQNPYWAAGIAGVGGLALASAMQPEQGGGPPPQMGPTPEQIAAAKFPEDSFKIRPYPKYDFVPSIYAAHGGELDVRAGGHLQGPGTGTSDSIPARLSDGEFVMTAKAVRGAGGGDRKKGANKMYDLMHQFEKRA